MAMATTGIPTKAIHEQWLGLVQPVGLVVAPAVLAKLELVPNQSPARLSAMQLELNGLLEEVEGSTGEPLKVVPSFRQLARQLLGWAEADLLPFEQLPPRSDGSRLEVVLAEYGETLRPTHGVPACDAAGETAGAEAGAKLQALVLLCRQAHADGAKMLIFSQYTRTLDIIELILRSFWQLGGDLAAPAPPSRCLARCRTRR
jgi:hypothetical protein